MPRSSLLALLLWGCAEDPTPSIELMVAVEEGEEALTLEVAPSVGVGELRMPVRLVNQYGMAVRGTSVSVTATGGTLESSELEFDAFGYADAVITSDGAAFVTVTTTASADGATPGASGSGALVTVEPPVYGMLPGAQLPMDGSERHFAAPSEDGIAVALDDEIWWAPYSTGLPGHRVADLQAEIGGLYRAEIDADGVPDLISWSGNTLYMLRGRPGGGYSHGAAWRALDGQIAGASATDLDADRLTDVAVAVTTESTGYLVVLFGNGAWGFTQSEAGELTFPIDSLSAADEAFDGVPDLTVINSATGSLRRYSLLGDDGWVGASTPEISAYEAAPGSELLPQADLDADGIDEIILAGAPGASSQDFIFFTMTDTVTQFPQAYGQFYPGVGELDLNPGYEIVALEDDIFHVTWYSAERDGFISKNITGVGDAGPIAIRDFNGDGFGDFAIAADQVAYFHGGTDVEGRYAADKPDWRTFSMGISGDPLILEENDDGLADVLAYVYDGEDLSVGLWVSTIDANGDTAFELSDIMSVGVGMEPHDLVTCDDDIYALFGVGNTSTLMKVDIIGGTANRRPDNGGTVDTFGTLLDCGWLDSDSSGAVVATTTGVWSTYTDNLQEQESGNLGAMSGVAILEESSGSEVVSCVGAGCSVVTVDTDSDGRDEVVRNEDVLSIEVDGLRYTLDGGGLLAAGDVDGDGVTDVLATDEISGQVAMYRSVPGGLAPAIALHAGRQLEGRARLGDLDGDGVPELIIKGESGMIMHTLATEASADSSW